MPPKIVQRMLLAIAILCGVSGCHVRRSNCCCLDTSVADANVTIRESANTGEIRSSFESIEQAADSQPLEVASFFSQGSTALDLKKCCCAAAINSPIADAIDKERQAMCCCDRYNRCVDEFLAGQALKQRNEAASIAGELFLRLVEIQLQQELLDESNDKLSELRAASKFADEQGFATVDADTEIDKQEIQLRNQHVELEENRTAVTAKLNAVLGISLCSPKTIYPIFELLPVNEPVETCTEIENAFTHRADLQALNQQGCGCMDSECYDILSNLDPRLGIGAKAAVQKCLLLKNLHSAEDCAKGIRNQQFDELKSARRELVRLEVTQAVLAIQSGYKKLSIEDDNVARLETRLEALDYSAELDSLDNYLKTIEVWSEIQMAKSARISKAIDFEIAKIKLVGATGRWPEICEIAGYKCYSSRSCCN